MDLFDDPNTERRNLLPYDGIVHYYGPIMSPQKADNYYQHLLNDIAWQHDEAVLFGKVITTKRKVAWYGDEAFSYTYSGRAKMALLWIPILRELKVIAEDESGETYNSCLLNLYHNGSEGMAWHSDAERDLKRDGAIASLSFGATRKFAFKHKRTNEKCLQILEHGSLLVMKGITQTHWLHSITKSKSITSSRINLTFRMIETNRP